jgi:hypothetical protein
MQQQGISTLNIPIAPRPFAFFLCFAFFIPGRPLCPLQSSPGINKKQALLLDPHQVDMQLAGRK